MKTQIFILLVFCLLLFIYACTKSTQPSQVSNYIPWNIGDARQIVYCADSSTILLRVVLTSKRQDGADIFALEWTYGTHEPDTFYYLFKDGFFLSTNLEAGVDSINPFREQRLGRVHPTDGESWKHTLGDLDSVYFTARHLNKQSTYSGIFYDVFAFVLTGQTGGRIDTILTTFYAQHIGWIGTSLNRDFRLDYSASYIKVDNLEYGSMMPAKNPSPPMKVPSVSNKQIIDPYFILGMRTAPIGTYFKGE